MAIEAGDIQWNIGADLKGFKAGMAEASKSASSIGDNFKKHSKAIGVGLTAAGAAGGLAIKGLVSSSQEFGKAMAEVNTLGVKNLDGLRDAVQNVSMEFGQDLTNSAKAAYQAISAGASEAETPLILEKAARAATAGVSDLSTAIELGTGVSNAFGVAFENMDQVFDKAFIAVKSGVTTFEELSASVGKVAPIMAGAGLSVDEMFASVAALTKGGIATSEAVTAMKAVISNVAKPTEASAKAAQKLGIEFDAAALKSKGLAGFLKEIEVAAGGDITIMTQLFGSMEAVNAAMALTGNQAADLNNILSEMKTGTGATQEAFDAFVAANPGFAFSQLKSTISVLAVEIGDKLAPHLIKLVEFIRPMIMGVIDWIRANEGLAVAMGGVFIALTGIATVLGPLLIALPGLIALFGGVTAAGALLGAKIAVGVIAGFVVLRGVFSEASGWIKANWDTISGVFMTSVAIIGNNISTLVNIVKTALGIVGAVLAGVGLAWGDTLRGMSDESADSTGSIGDTLLSFAQKFEELSGWIAEQAKGMSDFVIAHWDEIVEATRMFQRMVLKPLGAVLKFMIGFTKRIVGLIDRLVGAFERLAGAQMPSGNGVGGSIPGRAMGGVVNEPFTLVGERGPEIAAFPRGTRILSNRDTRRAVAEGVSGSGSIDNSSSLSMDGMVINVSGTGGQSSHQIAQDIVNEVYRAMAGTWNRIRG